MTKACCSPSRDASAPPPDTPEGARRVAPHAVAIPGGKALRGTAHPRIPDDGEDPLQTTTVKPFLMGATTVTNTEFAAFAAATGYTTEAERFGWSFVFHGDLPADHPPTQGIAGLEWWRRVESANWRDVTGPDTGHKPDHPAVHISWNDARAYAAWVGGRLPTEAEWEHAARAGQGDVPYPWGTRDPNDTDHFPCNIFQGRFPGENTAADGHAATAPAQSFAPNAYGLYNMVGNVWEWTADPFKIKSLKKPVKHRLAGMRGYKLLKGGSYLCHASYCTRYRIPARSGNSPDSTTTHQGFRVVWPPAAER